MYGQGDQWCSQTYHLLTTGEHQYLGGGQVGERTINNELIFFNPAALLTEGTTDPGGEHDENYDFLNDNSLIYDRCCFADTDTDCGASDNDLRLSWSGPGTSVVQNNPEILLDVDANQDDTKVEYGSFLQDTGHGLKIDEATGGEDLTQRITSYNHAATNPEEHVSADILHGRGQGEAYTSTDGDYANVAKATDNSGCGWATYGPGKKAAYDESYQWSQDRSDSMVSEWSYKGTEEPTTFETTNPTGKTFLRPPSTFASNTPPGFIPTVLGWT